MFRRIFIACTAIIICVRAQPSRLKILPGLAFYRTDDGHDDSDNSLMDKDKDLLKSMWNIVDKMDNKQHPSASAGGTEGTFLDGVEGSEFPENRAGEFPEDRQFPEESSSGRPLPGGSSYGQVKTPPSGVSSQAQVTAHSAPSRTAAVGGHRPPLGTPITTINVYSSFPGGPITAEKPFTATTTYHHLPFHGNAFGGATPFSSNADRNANGNNNNRFNPNHIPNPAPGFDASKGPRPFNSFMPPQNNQGPFEGLPPTNQDSSMTHAQFDSMMNPNGGLTQLFDRPGENQDNLGRGMYNPNQGDDMVQGFVGSDMENSAGSAPLHYMMSHMNPNAPMRPMEELMNVDPLRSHMNY